MGFAVRVRSAGQKYGPTCHQRDRSDVTEFITLVRLSSLGQHVAVLALAGYKRRKSALTAGPIGRGPHSLCTSQERGGREKERGKREREREREIVECTLYSIYWHLTGAVRSPEKSPMVKEAEETETCCFIDPSYEGCCQCLKLGLNLDVLPYPEQVNIPNHT